MEKEKNSCGGLVKALVISGFTLAALLPTSGCFETRMRTRRTFIGPRYRTRIRRAPRPSPRRYYGPRIRHQRPSYRGARPRRR